MWQINSLRLLKECQTFVQTSSGKYEALKSEHDDAIMASAIAFFLDAEMGSVEEYNTTTLKGSKRVRRPGEVFVSDLFAYDTDESDRDPHLGRWW